VRPARDQISRPARAPKKRDTEFYPGIARTLELARRLGAAGYIAGGLVGGVAWMVSRDHGFGPSVFGLLHPLLWISKRETLNAMARSSDGFEMDQAPNQDAMNWE